MRERPVPCRFASLPDARAGRHITWNDSAICDRCQAHELAAAAATRGRRDGDDPTPTGSSPTT